MNNRYFDILIFPWWPHATGLKCLRFFCLGRKIESDWDHHWFWDSVNNTVSFIGFSVWPTNTSVWPNRVSVNRAEKDKSKVFIHQFIFTGIIFDIRCISQWALILHSMIMPYSLRTGWLFSCAALDHVYLIFRFSLVTTSVVLMKKWTLD